MDKKLCRHDFYFKILILIRPRVAIFDDIIKIVTVYWNYFERLKKR